MSSFKVRVTKDYTVFSSGHFITYEGQCEPLHGHNYRAAASVEGALDSDSVVVNFVTLKKLLRSICDRLDHRMLLPTRNPLLDIREEGASFVVRHQDKTYVFPREDVVQLPLSNTTAEKLAEWIGGEIEAALRERGARGLTAVEVEVEETFGQAAHCRREMPPG